MPKELIYVCLAFVVIYLGIAAYSILVNLSLLRDINRAKREREETAFKKSNNVSPVDKAWNKA